MSEDYGASFKKLLKMPINIIGFAFWFISGCVYIMPLMDGPRDFERRFNVIQTDIGKAGWLILGGIQIPIMLTILFLAYHHKQTGSEVTERRYMNLIKVMMLLLIPYWICILFL